MPRWRQEPEDFSVNEHGTLVMLRTYDAILTFMQNAESLGVGRLVWIRSRLSDLQDSSNTPERTALINALLTYLNQLVDSGR